MNEPMTTDLAHDENISKFVPSKYRSESDNLAAILNRHRKAIAELEREINNWLAEQKRLVG